MAREETLIAENQVVEAGYTLGRLNQMTHSLIDENAGSPAVSSLETGHMRYEQGKGVVKIEEATCSICEDRGYDDGKWHAVGQRS